MYLASFAENAKRAHTLIHVRERVSTLHDERAGRSLNFTPVVTERGINDMYGYGLWLYKSIYDSRLNRDPHAMQLIRDTVAFWDEIDALAYIDMDLATAQERRVEQGLPREGRFVNERVWPHIERGYHWFFENVYPILQKKWGTGLIIINGRESMERNSEMIADYYEQVSAMSEGKK